MSITVTGIDRGFISNLQNSGRLNAFHLIGRVETGDGSDTATVIVTPAGLDLLTNEAVQRAKVRREADERIVDALVRARMDSIVYDPEPAPVRSGQVTATAAYAAEARAAGIPVGEPAPKPASKSHLYRWECDSCTGHGRWLRDGNLAQVFGSNHEDRHATSGGRLRHRAHIVDGNGGDHGWAS